MTTEVETPVVHTVVSRFGADSHVTLKAEDGELMLQIKDDDDGSATVFMGAQTITAFCRAVSFTAAAAARQRGEGGE